MLSVPISNPEEMKRYRNFLGLTQSELASELQTTTTSVSRWESEIVPIAPMTMAHLREMIVVRLQQEIKGLVAALVPKLTISRYHSLFSVPDARFTKDRDGHLYLGSVYIDPGYKRHVLYLRVDDRKWYGLDRDERATEVDEEFLRGVIASSYNSLARIPT